MSNIVIPLNISVNASSSLPISSGLVTDFDFSRWQTMAFSAGKVTQITDAVGSIVSSQVVAPNQPTFHSNGGPGNNSYASFNGSNFLSGALLNNSSSWTMFIIRRVPNGVGSRNAQYGVFQNGSGSTGYGWGDYTQTGGAYSCPVFPSGVDIPATNSFTFYNNWEVICVSHTSGVTKQYNVLNNTFLPVSTANPTTPATGHSIGALTGYNNGVFDLTRIILYNRQLSDGEVATTNFYLRNRYKIPLPIQYVAGGDSITNGAPFLILNQYPFLANYDLSPNTLMYSTNTGYSGRYATDVLANLASEVLNTYQSGAKNIYSLMIGKHDIQTIAPATVYSTVTSIINQCKAAGFKVIMQTMLYTTSYASSLVDPYNTLIRNNTAGADAILDTNQVTGLTDPTNTTYFIDGTHPTQAGQQLITNAIEPVISSF